MTVIVKLNHYLETLAHEERFKPEAERRDVPTLTALSKELPITRSTLQRLVGGETKGIQFDVLDGIIKAMRRRGWPTEITDILEYRNGSAAKNGKES